MKTYKQWLRSRKNFDEFVQPGDTVDGAMVDYFRNVLTPKRMSFGYLQVGEPIDQQLDPETNRYRTTYATFEKQAGEWVYRGCCFVGGTENQAKPGDPWK